MPRMKSDPGFWDRLSVRYAGHPISDSAGYEHTIERVQQLLEPGDRVLEFGCGTGTTALRLAPSVASYTATDFSSGMIEMARQRAEAARCEKLRFEIATVDAGITEVDRLDAVLSFNVLHLVEDVNGTLETVKRRLRPGGLFISKTPCMKDLGFFMRNAIRPAQWLGKAPFLNFFSSAELSDMIAASGFEIVHNERHASKGRDVRPFIVARTPQPLSI